MSVSVERENRRIFCLKHVLTFCRPKFFDVSDSSWVGLVQTPLMVEIVLITKYGV